MSFYLHYMHPNYKNQHKSDTLFILTFFYNISQNLKFTFERSIRVSCKISRFDTFIQKYDSCSEKLSIIQLFKIAWHLSSYFFTDKTMPTKVNYGS